MMNAHVLQDQVPLALRTLDPSGHEPDQDLRCHVLRACKINCVNGRGRLQPVITGGIHGENPRN